MAAQDLGSEKEEEKRVRCKEEYQRNAWRFDHVTDSREQMQNFGREERQPSTWSPLELRIGSLIRRGIWRE